MVGHKILDQLKTFWAPVEEQGGRRQKVLIIFGQYQNKTATVYCILQIINSSYSTSSASICHRFFAQSLETWGSVISDLFLRRCTLTLKVRILQFLMTFIQVTARLKNFLIGWLLVMGLKVCLVESESNKKRVENWLLQ